MTDSDRNILKGASILKLQSGKICQRNKCINFNVSWDTSRHLTSARSTQTAPRCPFTNFPNLYNSSQRYTLYRAPFYMMPAYCSRIYDEVLKNSWTVLLNVINCFWYNKCLEDVSSYFLFIRKYHLYPLVQWCCFIIIYYILWLSKVGKIMSTLV